MKTFLLEIITPFGKYLSEEVEFLNVLTTRSLLGILPNHTPLISDVLISEMIVKKDGQLTSYAIGGGILNIKKEKVILLLNSIEREDEIDLKRAQDAKKRAEERLKQAHKENEIDIARAEAALSRALNRIKVYSK